LTDEIDIIRKDASRPAAEANQQARDAWRGWVIPAVGSAAFFSSMLMNGIKNYQRYGFPAHLFNKMDWLLLSLPIIVVIAALSDLKPDKKEGSV
jgi:hypothetical protein